MPPGAIPRLDGAPVEPFALRRLDAEYLTSEIEVELELPRVRCPKEVESLAQIAIRMIAIPVPDQIALGDDAVDGRTDHQKRPVKLTAVESDEARVALEELPELFKDLLLATGDVG